METNNETIKWSFTNSNNSDYIDIDGDTRICSMDVRPEVLEEQGITLDEALSNAEKIVTCVNGYDALLEENKRLKNLLIAYKDMVGNTGYSIAKEQAKFLYDLTNKTLTLNSSTVKEDGSNG